MGAIVMSSLFVFLQELNFPYNQVKLTNVFLEQIEKCPETQGKEGVKGRDPVPGCRAHLAVEAHAGGCQGL
jgi:hypothetical protein